MPLRDLRVCVILDWQNLYHRAREAFVDPGTPASAGQVDPLSLGRLCVSRVAGGVLTGVRVYRGRPSRHHDVRSYSAFRRQTEHWFRGGAGLVSVAALDLRYPHEWPLRPAQEKGVDVALAVDFVLMCVRREYDVGILFSGDTDLVPALRAVVALRPGEPPACEVAAWAPPTGRPRALAVRRLRLKRHLFDETDFRAVADPTDYTRRQ